MQLFKKEEKYKTRKKTGRKRERERERLSKMEERNKDVDPPPLLSPVRLSFGFFFSKAPRIVSSPFCSNEERPRENERSQPASMREEEDEKERKEDEEIRELVQR